jgi:hypothetical protein
MDDEPAIAEMQKVRLSKDPLPVAPTSSRARRIAAVLLGVLLGVLLLGLLAGWLIRLDSGSGSNSVSTSAPSGPGPMELGTTPPAVTVPGASAPATPSPSPSVTSQPPSVAVPDVLGLTCLDAVTVLRGRGVAAVTVRDVSGRRVVATQLQFVVSQSIAAGEPISAGTTVTLVCAADARGKG